MVADMVKLADEFDIKYVAETTFDYDSTIQPPFYSINGMPKKQKTAKHKV